MRLVLIKDYLSSKWAIRSLALLLVFRAVQLLNTNVDSFYSAEVYLPYCFNSITEGYICGFALTPIYLIGLRDFFRSARSTIWVLRAGGRHHASLLLVSVVLLHSFLFSIIVVVSGELIVAIRSSHYFEFEGYALLLAVYGMLEMAFFASLGLLASVCLNLTASVAFSMALAFVYGVFDFLLSMLLLGDAATYFCGWALTMLDVDQSVGDLVGKGVRLACIMVVMLLALVLTSQKSDYLAYGGERDE